MSRPVMADLESEKDLFEKFLFSPASQSTRSFNRRRTMQSRFCGVSDEVLHRLIGGLAQGRFGVGCVVGGDKVGGGAGGSGGLGLEKEMLLCW
ncbi:hypothetical protein C5167_041667 [Papaver somniferum]|nr:hypothetical protein C5167_041667 [Papaver somniferum]